MFETQPQRAAITSLKEDVAELIYKHLSNSQLFDHFPAAGLSVMLTRQIEHTIMMWLDGKQQPTD